jgi:hypothetical protein
MPRIVGLRKPLAPLHSAILRHRKTCHAAKKKQPVCHIETGCLLSKQVERKASEIDAGAELDHLTPPGV